MKTKGGSLYEVLKSASRPSGADEGAPTSPEPPASGASEGASSTLQERLAAYKAAKLAAATHASPAPAGEASPVRPAAPTLVLEPDPTPIPPMVTPTVLRPLPAPAAPAVDETPLPAPARGPGERVVKLTYNTVLFGGMVAVGLLFVAYAVGLHVGKGQAVVETPVERAVARPPAPIVPAPLPAPPPVPAPPRKEYTIRLGEWRFVTSQEKVKALALADDPELKKQLERAGHRGFEKAYTRNGAEVKMLLYVNRYTDLNTDAARSALTAMKTFRFRGQTPFAHAAFEEKPPQ